MRVVILGTGTDVGKTYFTAGLARSLRGRMRVLALKPIESGVGPGVAGDAGVIAEAAGHAPALSRWRFAPSLSPHVGAREAGAPIALAEVVTWIGEQERRVEPGVLLVELAGGAFSPLGVGLTNVDLARALEPALWLLVAPDALGVLHDVTATLAALPRAPDGIVLSAARAADPSTGTNAAELSRLGIAEVIEVIAAGADGGAATADWLVRHQTYKSGR